MTVTMTRARALCSKSELVLVLASTPAQRNLLSASRLRSKVIRARKLRDKYRDLAAGQRREARGKQSPRSARPARTNANTALKAQLFDEVLTRFQAQLERVEAGSATPTPKQERQATKSARKAAKQERKTERREDPAVPTRADDVPATPAAARPTKVPPRRSRKKPTLKGSALPPAAPRKKAARKLPRATARRAQSEDSAAFRVQDTQKRSGQKKVQGHIAARGRRNQAKRDAR